MSGWAGPVRLTRRRDDLILFAPLRAEAELAAEPDQVFQEPVEDLGLGLGLELGDEGPVAGGSAAASARSATVSQVRSGEPGKGRVRVSSQP